ncbi:AAA family ATPase [Alloscardovia venturai]|uniref:AAA family ATPase n=1 Tax=Alloscardovia venturai TaxID=1769421 RepID=A0ABW2Y6G5_9BIFI
MHISRIHLVNFRCFEDQEFQFNRGINFLVGNNNCGKTTVLRAIEFIQLGGAKDQVINQNHQGEDVTVEIDFTGDNLGEYVVDNDDLKKYKKYLINDSTFRIRRSSEETSWEDDKGKEKKITIKNVAF